MTSPSGPVIDPVVKLLEEDRSDYRDLYYRWEQERWEAGAIDLSGAIAAWPDLDGSVRRHLADATHWRRVRSELATTALVAFVDSAPTEEQQVFLTTQLVDEARAGVFLDRVAAEVLGAPGADMAARSGAAGDIVDPELLALLDRSLPEAAAALRAAADPIEPLVSAVAAYHLGVVGMLGLTELWALLEEPAAARGLAGIAEGLRMIERDTTRHVAFALLFLADSTDDARSRRALERSLDNTVPAVVAALASMAEVAPGLGTADELGERATNDVVQWLRAVKLRVPAFAP